MASTTCIPCKSSFAIGKDDDVTVLYLDVLNNLWNPALSTGPSVFWEKPIPGDLYVYLPSCSDSDNKKMLDCYRDYYQEKFQGKNWIKTFNSVSGIGAPSYEPQIETVFYTGVGASSFLNFTNVEPDTQTGNGYGVKINIQTNFSNNYVNLNFPDRGKNYFPGDVLTIKGSTLGGVDGVNDLVITVDTVFNPTGEVTLMRAIPTATSGNGTGAVFSVTKTLNYNTGLDLYTVNGFIEEGSGYLPGDTVTISGVLLGGVAGPAPTGNDLTFELGPFVDKWDSFSQLIEFNLRTGGDPFICALPLDQIPFFYVDTFIQKGIVKVNGGSSTVAEAVKQLLEFFSFRDIIEEGFLDIGFIQLGKYIKKDQFHFIRTLKEIFPDKTYLISAVKLILEKGLIDSLSIEKQEFESAIITALRVISKQNGQTQENLLKILEVMLNRGLVIQWGGRCGVGIMSIEKYLKYAEAVGLTP